MVRKSATKSSVFANKANNLANLREQYSGGLYKAAAFILFAAGIYVMLALVSFDPDDASWVNTYNSEDVKNPAGPLGAWIAYTLNFLFGYVSFWIVVAIFISAYLLFFKDTNKSQWPQALRWLGSGFILIALCGLLAIHFSGAGMPASAGGWFGQFIARAFTSTLGLIGSTLLLLAILGGSLHLIADISWLRIMDMVGGMVLTGIQQLQQLPARFHKQKLHRETLQQRRVSVSEHISKHKERLYKRKQPVPRIEPSISDSKPGKRASKEKQMPLFVDKKNKLPLLGMLDRPAEGEAHFSKQSLDNMAKQLELKLADFGIEAEVVEVQTGPVVTRFELMPVAGTKASRITSLEKDLARALSVSSVRVIEVIAGKSVVGLEIPNEFRQTVFLSELLNSEIYEKSKSSLVLALGKDVTGKTVLEDLQKMPHLLVAGTTGAGKSVAVHAMLLSLLFKSLPDTVRFILIDPKMLELSVYEGIPHLLTPVITDVKLSAHALRWAVAEMENRYRLMSALGVRNLEGFNHKIAQAQAQGKPLSNPLLQASDATEGSEEALESLYHIVVVIDEFADMIMTVGKQVEELIARLAQKARAAGIHLIIATQRPSVDVITGLIKANIPARIAFQVSSMVDSRTILGQKGAEQLLGKGDMLYLGPGSGILERVHGAFVSDEEVKKVVDFLKQQGQPDYLSVLENDANTVEVAVPGLDSIKNEGEDPLYDNAIQIVLSSRKASVSYLQRRLRVGYNRAARLVEQMEEQGIVSPVQPNGSREVLGASPD